MASFTRQQQRAKAKLRAKGGQGVLSKRTRGALDLQRDTTLGDETVEYIAYAIWPAGRAGGRDVAPGTLVGTDAEYLLLAAAEFPDGVAPEPGDQWVQDEATYAVGPVAAVKPDGVTAILYRCAVRKGAPAAGGS